MSTTKRKRNHPGDAAEGLAVPSETATPSKVPRPTGDPVRLDKSHLKTNVVLQSKVGALVKVVRVSKGADGQVVKENIWLPTSAPKTPSRAATTGGGETSTKASASVSGVTGVSTPTTVIDVDSSPTTRGVSTPAVDSFRATPSNALTPNNNSTPTKTSSNACVPSLSGVSTPTTATVVNVDGSTTTFDIDTPTHTTTSGVSMPSAPVVVNVDCSTTTFDVDTSTQATTRGVSTPAVVSVDSSATTPHAGTPTLAVMVETPDGPVLIEPIVSRLQPALSDIPYDGPEVVVTEEVPMEMHADVSQTLPQPTTSRPQSAMATTTTTTAPSGKKKRDEPWRFSRGRLLKDIHTLEDLMNTEELVKIDSRLSTKTNYTQNPTVLTVSGKQLVEWIKPPEAMTAQGVHECLRLASVRKEVYRLHKMVRAAYPLEKHVEYVKTSFFTKLLPADVRGLGYSMKQCGAITVPSNIKVNVPGSSAQARHAFLHQTMRIIDEAVNGIKCSDFNKVTHGGMSLIEASWDIIKSVLYNCEDS